LERWAFFTIREEVQRLFEGAKKKNVPAYAEYVVALAEGEDGITPPITLYSSELLKVDQKEDGTAFIQVPWDERLTAIDGETQLAARHEAANTNLETKKVFIPVYLAHGKDQTWARQCFHDLNTLGVKPSAALSLGMDARDPITKVCRAVENEVPFLKGRVNKVRRQLRSSDPEITTIAALRGACVTLAKGINGVQFGARPAQVDESQLPKIKATAVEWFKAITSTFGPILEDRENNLLSAPAVWAAIGAVGHELSLIDGRTQVDRCRELLASLQKVNWTRGKAWEGIAGKFTPKGAFSLGEPKETAYAIYAALTNPDSEGYTRIRKAEAVAA